MLKFIRILRELQEKIVTGWYRKEYITEENKIMPTTQSTKQYNDKHEN